MSYEPGTYVKGDSERVAKNAREAVALSFQGYRPKPAEAPVDSFAESFSEPEIPAPAAPKPRKPEKDSE